MSTKSGNVKSKNLVSFPKSFHIPAYRFNIASQRSPQTRLFGFSEPQLYPAGEPEGERDIESPNSSIPDVCGCCKDLDEYFIVLGDRLFDLLELKKIR